MDDHELSVRFDTHAPTENQKERMGDVRAYTKDLVTVINSRVPDGRDKSLAMTKLDESLFHAIAGIAREGL